MGAVGPGVIVLGASIGGGEFLLGPTVFVRHGLTLLWVTTVAVFFQTVFNTELMRYTLATGEPVFTGFMRTRPHAVVWAWFYAILFFLQVGWPASAGVASGAIFFLFTRRMPGVGDVNAVYLIGVGTFLLCVMLLLLGRRIERTLELLNWIMVVCTLGGRSRCRSCWCHSQRGGPRSRDWPGSTPHGRSSTSCRPRPISSCSRPSSPTPGLAG
jgi:Mn2+/Fe2+ NRAMP family transporter